jgi:hypothetical protein
MAAFAFAIGLFAYLSLLGRGLLAIFPARAGRLGQVLASPALGLSVLIIPVFVLNRLGIPVRQFATPLAGFLALSAATALVLKRPRTAWRGILVHGVPILLIGALLTGWPMLKFGFDWVSYANDDMANYCLGAQRFLEHGYTDRPDMDAILAGRDYSAAFWFMHVAHASRAGSELFLATVWGATGVNAHRGFMPTILALNLVLLCSVGLLARVANGRNRTGWVAMGVAALLPLSSLGVMYQVIGQVGGLALLVSTVALLVRRPTYAPYVSVVRSIVCPALLLSGLLIWYPEVVPFLALGWALFFSMALLPRRRSLRPTLLSLLVLVAIVSILLRGYLFDMVLFMLGQTAGGIKPPEADNILFPYFLLPSGLPALFGLLSITPGDVNEPWMSLAILAGACLLAWIVARSLLQLRRGSPAAAVFAVMCAVALVLFARRNDFGLFKLAMFMQPFLAVVASQGAGAPRRRFGLEWAVAIACVPLLAVTQWGYVARSLGEGLVGGLTEIPHASAEALNRRFANFFAGCCRGSGRSFLSDTPNVVESKFQALYTRGTAVLFPSDDFISNHVIGRPGGQGASRATPQGEEALKQYNEQRKLYYRTYTIGTGSSANQFEVFQPRPGDEAPSDLLYRADASDIFNRFERGSAPGRPFGLLGDRGNYLIFVASSLGSHYYYAARRTNVSFYQLENDPMFPGREVSGLGPLLLFRIINPTGKARLVMDLTDSVLSQNERLLPDPVINNDPTSTLGFVGRGSGRVISPLVSPLLIDGKAYVQIDMGRPGRLFPIDRQWLMSLYGRQVPRDQRQLTAFGRDISLISEDQYQHLNPPGALRNFPDDLANPGLQYSGVYEDGWVSERSFFVLASTADAQPLLIEGMVPQIGAADFTTEVSVRIDGVPVLSRKLGTGSFSLRIPTTGPAGKHRVDLDFDRLQTLQGDDGRPVAGLMKGIGFGS